MKKVTVSIFMICLLIGCQSEETKFQKCEAQFNENWMQFYEDLPFESNAIYDVEKLNQEEPFLSKALQSLNGIDENQLIEIDRQSFVSLHEGITTRIDFLENKIKKDPSVFSLKKELEDLIATEASTMEEVLKTLERFPRFYEFAKSNMSKPELEKIEDALDDQKEIYFLLKNRLPLWAKEHATTSLAANHFTKKNKEAMLSIKDWIAFLNSEKFEIGNDLMNN